MSPNTNFGSESPLDSPLVERLLEDDMVVYEVGDHEVVLAMRSDLIVRRSARVGSARLAQALGAMATPCGSLASLGTDRRPPDSGDEDPGDPGDPAADVEVWRLIDRTHNAIDVGRRLSRLAPDATVATAGGAQLQLPPVSPNHLAIVCPRPSSCPAGPPQPTPAPHDAGAFVQPLSTGTCAEVVVIDTGYIHTDPPYPPLDDRVDEVAGEMLNVHVDPPAWVTVPPDAVTTDAEGRLLEIVGHGTFVAGLIAHLCPAARLTVVGQRDQDILITGESAPEQKRLFSSELALAHALLLHKDADIIQFGFSFPTLDNYPSIPFTRAMQVLTGPGARPGIAVVCPAGNETSAQPYWPAALPGVIGVAATNRRARHRANFSNWGAWLECCARGEDVVSRYIDFVGPVQGDHLAETERFEGWSRWDGTSFSAPKVSAAIARVYAEHAGALTPIEAFDLILARQTDIRVTDVLDSELTGLPGVTLPQLHVH